MKKTYTIRGKVEKFPQAGGWFYIRVPKRLTAISKKSKATKWGLIPAKVTVGETTWKTSLLPMGDGTLFIALKAQVRKREDVGLGKTITAHFTLK